MNEADVRFLQTADPYHYYGMLIETAKTVKLFCQRWGFRYESYIGIKRGYYSWHAAFNRIILLKEMIDAGFRGWIFYLDADSYIVQQDFDLRSYLADKFEYCAILTPSTATDHWWDINDGVFLLNANAPQGRDLVEHWHAAFMEISDAQLRVASRWHDVPHDQDLLHRVLQNTPQFENEIHLGSPKLLNSADATFVRQFYRSHCENIYDRITLIRQKIAEATVKEASSIFDDNMPKEDQQITMDQQITIVSTLYRTILKCYPSGHDIGYFTNMLQDPMGLEYGVSRLTEALLSDQARRMNELERENQRLLQAVADLTAEKTQVVQERDDLSRANAVLRGRLAATEQRQQDLIDESRRWFEAATASPPPDPGAAIHPVLTLFGGIEVMRRLAPRFDRRQRLLGHAADEARDRQQWELAARLYRERLVLNPNNAAIWIQYGHSLKEAGQIEAAREAYDMAVKADPKSAVGYFFLGHVLQLLGHTQEAGEAFRTSIALDPRLLEFCPSDAPQPSVGTQP